MVSDRLGWRRQRVGALLLATVLVVGGGACSTTTEISTDATPPATGSGSVPPTAPGVPGPTAVPSGPFAGRTDCGPTRYPGSADPGGRIVPAIGSTTSHAPTTAGAGFAPQVQVQAQVPTTAGSGPTSSTVANLGDQSWLQGDLQTVNEYGAQHGDEFTAVKFDNAGPVMVVISFVAHVEEHRAALLGLVEHPDRLRVDQSCRTQIDLKAIRDKVMDMVNAQSGHVLRSLGSSADRGWVNVGLSASSEELAKQIKAEFGDAVSIIVGNWLYPYELTNPEQPGASIPPEALCPMSFEQLRAFTNRGSTRPPTPVGTVDGLTMTVVIDQPPTERGGEFKGHVTFTNAGRAAFTVDEHALFAIVVDGDHQVVEAYSAAQDLAGRWHTLQPGETFDVDLIGDTGTCVPNAGYTLAPGTYGVIVAPVITVGASSPGSPGGADTVVVSPEAPLTVR